MPKVHHVKKARKDNPAAKKGESYYWWKFRFGGKHYSKTYPKQQQLTRSGFKKSLYDIEDTIESSLNAAKTKEDLQALIDSICLEIEELRDECEESLSNMPDHLQDTSQTGILLQERIDSLNEWVNEFENFNTECEDTGFGDMKEDLESICYQGN